MGKVKREGKGEKNRGKVIKLGYIKIHGIIHIPEVKLS